MKINDEREMLAEKLNNYDIFLLYAFSVLLPINIIPLSME